MELVDLGDGGNDSQVNVGRSAVSRLIAQNGVVSIRLLTVTVTMTEGVVAGLIKSPLPRNRRCVGTHGSQVSIGLVILRVLLDAGVFKRTEEGKAAFKRFIDRLVNLT